MNAACEAIEYYDAGDEWTVVCPDGDVLTMARPGSPLGINQYVGSLTSPFSRLDPSAFGERTDPADVPTSIVEAARARCGLEAAQ